METQSIVEVLQVSRADIAQKFPKDVQNLIEEKATQKLNWIKKRLIDICFSIEQLSKWGNLQEDFSERVQDVQRKFPKATYSTLSTFIGQL